MPAAPRAPWNLIAASVLIGASLVCADDGVDLTVTKGAAPGEVRLDWTGGSPSFHVYRSAIAHRTADAANELGATTTTVWLDTPPAGDIFYYRVMGPCQTATPESCDGVDDDCDGLIDNGCGPCFTASDCDSLDRAPACDSQSTCQGSGRQGYCDPTGQCLQVVQDNDSGCAGLQSNDCGSYSAVLCTSAPSQPANQATFCASSCLLDTECDAAAHCDSVQKVCMPDFPAGFACSADNECGSGFCVDGVCCNSSCTGTCAACDLPGTVGDCTRVPDGQDPDAECSGVSCAGYYWGFSGDTCYRKADVSAGQATCSGTTACRTTAAECTAQPTQGAAAVTCNSLCQDPNLTTCSGTTPGACTNVPGGTTICGFGPCQVTSPNCVGGSPNTCVPNSGAASTETCDDLDNNCDGTVDNGTFGDGFETNNDCNTYRTLPTVGSDQTLTQNSVTLYPSGDIDYFRIVATESDSSCACCDGFCTDEDYRLTVTLTVPAGAGSYQFCAATSCAGVSANCLLIAAGASNAWNFNLDGGCPGNDSYNIWVRISPNAAPGFECRPYTLSYHFDSGLCL